MEAGGGDGGSDVSYESVASEGGYEPASERGRDPLPRIISSSHCVEVFRRVRWADGAFCCRAPSADEGEGRGKASPRKDQQQQLCPHDPLSGLPPRLLRFDGAMEAWLEEMPLPRDPLCFPRPYASLNDAAARHAAPGGSDLSILRAGNRRATVWYFTLEFLQQLWPLFLQPDASGMKFWERALLDRGCTIQSTHIEVGQVHCPPGKGGKRSQWLKSLFTAMQATKWTPDGEARTLLVKRRLSHASMSIGDAVQIGGELFVAGLVGFVQVKEGERLLPASFENENEAAKKKDGWKDGRKDGGKEAGGKSGGEEGGAKEGGAKEGSEEGGKDGGRKRGGKGGKGGNKGAGKGAGGGRGGKGADKGEENDGARREKGPRAKEPVPAAGRAAPGADRADRRKLRAQLQAKREQLQGGQ